MLFLTRKFFFLPFRARSIADTFGFSASILLHEIFCNRQDKSDDSALARCLTSAKCVVNSTYVLFSSSNDLSAIDP